MAPVETLARSIHEEGPQNYVVSSNAFVVVIWSGQLHPFRPSSLSPARLPRRLARPAPVLDFRQVFAGGLNVQAVKDQLLL